MVIPSSCQASRNQLLAAVVLLTGILGAAGCGGSGGPGAGGAEGDAIAALVQQFPDYTGNAKQFRDILAQGADVPEKDRPRYGKYQYSAAAPPSVSGDTATVKVRVYDDSAGKEVGQVNWAFAKEGSKWKLKSAPLP